MISFFEYLAIIKEGATSAKTGLYPLGYGGIGNYPPEYAIPSSADALYYISADERLQKVWEKEPFKIDHLKPIPIWNKKQGKQLFVAATAKLPPGNVVPPKGTTLPGDIKPINGKKHKCQVDNPSCLPANLVGKKAETYGDPCPNTFKMPK
jgi:hypothetical protein